MGLIGVLVQVAVIALAMLTVATVLFVDLSDLRTAVQDRKRYREVAPYVGGLLAVLGLNKIIRDVGVRLSLVFGRDITAWIRRLEGDFVAQLQGIATPWLTDYLSFMYIHGYVFMLIFPFILYFALPSTAPFRELAVAFGTNYVIGMICYVLFIAYGPRNTITDLVSPLLYSNIPLAQLLTGEVNVNTNVFPSLHTSLSVTVFLLAWRTRREYPRWVPIAGAFAFSITFSTMYTGIHWFTDVIAGIFLAVISVVIAIRTVRGVWPEPLSRVYQRLRRTKTGDGVQEDAH